MTRDETLQRGRLPLTNIAGVSAENSYDNDDLNDAGAAVSGDFIADAGLYEPLSRVGAISAAIGRKRTASNAGGDSRADRQFASSLSADSQHADCGRCQLFALHAVDVCAVCRSDAARRGVIRRQPPQPDRVVADFAL